MNLSDARKAKIPRKKKFPVGHGHSSGAGEWCQRGNKGQYSRQGTSFRAYFEGGQMPIIRRLPKRGFNNAEFRRDYEEVNVGSIDRLFADGATIDEAALRERGLLRRHLPVKILGGGPLARKVTVKAHRFTKSAEEKIAKAGGTVVKLEAPVEEPPKKAAGKSAQSAAPKGAPEAGGKAPEGKPKQQKPSSAGPRDAGDAGKAPEGKPAAEKPKGEGPPSAVKGDNEAGGKASEGKPKP